MFFSALRNSPQLATAFAASARRVPSSDAGPVLALVQAVMSGRLFQRLLMLADTFAPACLMRVATSEERQTALPGGCNREEGTTSFADGV